MRYLLILCAGVLMACNSNPENAAAKPDAMMDLAGSEWNMGDGSDAFVAFKADGKVLGSGGCNSFGGQYSQNGDAIEIGPLAATKKMCPPEIMRTETKLFGLLDSARYVKASHLKLTLFGPNREELATLNRSDWD